MVISGWAVQVRTPTDTLDHGTVAGRIRLAGFDQAPRAVNTIAVSKWASSAFDAEMSQWDEPHGSIGSRGRSA
jgi:hypothetical protein